MTPTCRSTTSRRAGPAAAGQRSTLKQFTAQIDGCTRYLTLQTDSGPTAKLEVRQAFNYAVDKQAIVRAVGGAWPADPSSTILTPPLVGYQKYDLYATPDNRGDPAKAKSCSPRPGTPTA